MLLDRKMLNNTQLLYLTMKMELFTLYMNVYDVLLKWRLTPGYALEMF